MVFGTIGEDQDRRGPARASVDKGPARVKGSSSNEAKIPPAKSASEDRPESWVVGPLLSCNPLTFVGGEITQGSRNIPKILPL